MAIDLGHGKSILSMSLLDINTGEETTLFKRTGSRCHFRDDIFLDDYIITLRVDWGDIRDTDPVLDADIYENVSGLKGRKLRNGPWHTTEKKFVPEENLSVYDFNFKELWLRLCTKSIIGLGARMDAIIDGLGVNEGET